MTKYSRSMEGHMNEIWWNLVYSKWRTNYDK